MLKKTILFVSLISFLGANEYQEWLKSQQKQYTQYKKTMDEEFSDMLKKDWEAFKSMSNPTPYKKPKPVSVPKIKKVVKIPKKDIQNSPKVKVKEIIKKIIKEKPIVKAPIKEVITKPEIKKPIQKIVKKPEVKKLEMPPGVPMPTNPPIIKIPTVKDDIKPPKVKEPIQVPKVQKPIVKKPDATVFVPPVKIDKPKVLKNFKMVKFDFYSSPIQIQYDVKSAFYIGKINKRVIAKYWDIMSQTKYKKLISQIDKKSEELNLNDWAKYQLIHKLGTKIYNDNNIANLFTWFVLVKMKYDTKVGYSRDKIYLLSTMKHKLFQISFFNLKGKKYYILTPNGKAKKVGSIYTYAGDYPKAKENLSFEIKKAIKFDSNISQKDLRFKYDGRVYKISTKYSNDLIDFYKTFPQSDYNIYFDTKNSTALNSTMLLRLAPLLHGKSEIEAVNFLLRFVQTSFAYKTDQKQFDYEKVMFPEETIFYPYSDCEDRSIMFSYLVKNILGLDVVGVKYNDHLATAVAFSSDVSGASFRYNNKTYTISDPTYINANAGMAMPKYKDSKFDIIALR